MENSVESPTRPSEDLAAKRASRTLKDYVGIALRGFAMGSADVVPGVSGGTMALITGIYEELIFSIRAIGRPDFVRPAIRLHIRKALDILNWPFLLAVFAGIFLALLTLAQGIEWFLDNQPTYLWSFFFGLVLASVITVGKRIKKWSIILLVGLLAGTVSGYLIVGAVPAQTPDTWWFLFLAGALASCAMILPGISGAFILVILGKYEFALNAVNSRDFVSLIILAMGAAVGLITFAQLLGWLFKRYHDATVAVLTGLMLGSLRKLWPWKETVEFMTDRHGELVPLSQINILPPLTVAGAFNMEILIAILVALLGFLLVMGIDRVANVQGR